MDKSCVCHHTLSPKLLNEYWWNLVLADKTQNLCANLILVWSFPAQSLLFTQTVKVKVTLEQAMKAQGGVEV
jgi:hypothetical protein